MPAILVLCKSPREAAEYGKLVGLPRFGYRYVARAGSIRGVRNAEVHVLPSFLGRLDRHSILTELRFSRMEVFYADPADFREEPEPSFLETHADAEVQWKDPAPITEERRAEFEKELAANVKSADDWAIVVNPEPAPDGPTMAELLDQQVMAENDGAPVGEPEVDPIDDPKINPDGRKRRYTCKVCEQKVFSDADPAHGPHDVTPPTASGFFG